MIYTYSFYNFSEIERIMNNAKNSFSNFGFNTIKALPEHRIPCFYLRQFFHEKDETQKDVWCYYHIGYPLYMHRHDFFEINVITNGFGTHYINNDKIDVWAGDVFIIPPGITHGYVDTGKLEVFHIVLNKSFFGSFENSLRSLNGYSAFFPAQTSPAQFTLNYARLTKDHFSSIHANINSLLEYRKNDIYSNKIQSSIVYQIICKLCRYNAMLAGQNKSNTVNNAEIIIKSINYIRKNFMHKISVDEIAKKVFLSKTTFVRHFTKYTNFTPVEYITQMRIDEAKKQLIHSSKTITDIAVDCGFYDSSYFEKTFRKHEHITPSYFRQLNR